jgi:preprotein translocase subunit SecG
MLDKKILFGITVFCIVLLIFLILINNSSTKNNSINFVTTVEVNTRSEYNKILKEHGI